MRIMLMRDIIRPSLYSWCKTHLFVCGVESKIRVLILFVLFYSFIVSNVVPTLYIYYRPRISLIIMSLEATLMRFSSTLYATLSHCVAFLALRRRNRSSLTS
ncbi:hypothetical protein C8J56DRAFT_975253 [Mycena floridula]|nr:hypothetical protein C8J56DRAFT_975253 [Mycena floridula]